MRKLENYTPTRFMAADSTYNKQMADYAVNFIECLCHTKGTWAGKPFELIDWQEQIIRDIFGTLKPNGYRQFNTAYVEIPKKMGKSELAAAVALLLTCGDGEERAEVYGCAADRQQATIVFDVAADMVRMCPALNRRVKILASQKRIVYQPTNSFYQVLSAEAYSKHGFNIHGVVFDELHTQPNRKLFDVMTKGSGDARMQPLYFLITTAGTDTNSICYETHQKAKRYWCLQQELVCEEHKGNLQITGGHCVFQKSLSVSSPPGIWSCQAWRWPCGRSFPHRSCRRSRYQRTGI